MNMMNDGRRQSEVIDCVWKSEVTVLLVLHTTGNTTKYILFLLGFVQWWNTTEMWWTFDSTQYIWWHVFKMLTKRSSLKTQTLNLQPCKDHESVKKLSFVLWFHSLFLERYLQKWRISAVRVKCAILHDSHNCQWMMEKQDIKESSVWWTKSKTRERWLRWIILELKKCYLRTKPGTREHSWERRIVWCMEIQFCPTFCGELTIMN